jgi:sugar phosphate isomerase/epimerase
MLPGYNTNGFAHHRLEDALDILADLGYRSVALTLDHHALDPFDPSLRAQVARVRQRLERHGLRCVIETGARFLLDRWRKHQPTLLDPAAGARQVRLDFLCRAVDLCAELQADAVSFWSGAPLALEPDETLMSRLVEGCVRLCEYAERQGVRLAFEPEPGMFIDSMARMGELYERVRQYPNFGLTLDIGHLQCLGEVPMRPHILRWAAVLWNVHIEDMRRGIHDHLMFGEGEIDFGEVGLALREAGYTGGLHVELSRHSHNAVETARQSLVVLQRLGEAR